MSYIKRDKKKVQSKLDALRKKLMNKKSIPKPKTFYSKSINKEIIDKQPLINILTRTSNRPNGFKINLESIHSQTYFNIRHLVTVDSDESEEYVKEYQKEYNFEYIRVNESDYKDVDEIPNPNTGKPFIWNHYFNTLLEKVEKGFIIYLDDDDRFANNLVLEKIAKQIKTQDDIILWQMEFQSGWVVPTDELIGKTPTFCRIGSPCFCYSSKYKDIKWDGWKCGDFRLIKRLYNQIPNSKWIHEVLVKLGNNGGDGKKID